MGIDPALKTDLNMFYSDHSPYSLGVLMDLVLASYQPLVADEVRTALSAITNTVTANTYLDVAGGSMVVPASVATRVKIGYKVNANLKMLGNGPQFVLGNTCLTLSNNTLIPDTLDACNAVLQDGGISQSGWTLEGSKIVTISTDTTYKLRARCSLSDTDAQLRIFAGVITGTLTPPEVNSYLYYQLLGPA